MRLRHSRSTIPLTMPLTPFKRWLENQGKSPRTVEAYASQVRTVLRTPEEAKELCSDPQRGQEAILAADAALLPTSRGAFRAALRAFDLWLLELGRESILPTFSDGRHREGGGKTALGSLLFLAPLLREIEEKVNPDMPWCRLAELKWKHVQGTGGPESVLIRDPGWSRSYTAPKAPMIQINMWAGNGNRAEPEQPIIPREPGSTYPLPAAILRKLSRA